MTAVPASGVRVMHLLPHVQDVGNGIVDVTVDLAISQAAAGLDVHVLSSGGELEPLLRSHRVSCHPGRLVPQELPRLARLVRRVSPDVVHTHTVKGLLLARMGSGLRPVLTSAHRDFGRQNVLLALATRAIAVSTGIAATLRRSVPGRRVVVVRNGVLGGPRRSARLAATAPAPVASPSVLYVGGLYRHKGVDVLLDAFVLVRRQLPAARLYIVGAGPDGDDLRQQAEDLGLGPVTEWVGFRPDAHRWLRAADVFVLPSRSETFGLVLAEAREAGVAIVASDVGGIPEVLDGGRAGRLVPVADIEALSTTLVELLTDASARATLAQAAGRDLEWLSVDRMRADVSAVYAEVLAQRRR